MKEVYQIAIEAALEAGKEILKVYESADFGVETKKDDSPLTLADKKGHDKIIEFLEKTHFPILSEESKEISYNERKDWKTYWLVDPLDGTKEFIKRNGEFTVNIALIENQVPVFGVIYVPVLKKLYFTEDSGAYLVENIIDFNALDNSYKILLQGSKVQDVIKIVASKSHLSTETEDKIHQITLENPSKKIEIVSMGSSLKLCLVAEGKAHFYPRYAPTMEWDTAAGDAICRKAGINVVQANTKESVLYNKENLLNPWFEVGNL